MKGALAARAKELVPPKRTLDVVGVPLAGGKGKATVEAHALFCQCVGCRAGRA